LQNTTQLKEALLANNFDIKIKRYQMQARFVSLRIISLVAKSELSVLNHVTFFIAYVQYCIANQGLHILTE
jgi:hypothetical protein